MKRLTGLALLLVAGGISLAADRRPNEIITVLVSVHFDTGKPRAPLVFRAKQLAAQMFAEAGVDIKWHWHLPVANRDLPPIVIDIALSTCEWSKGDVLAYAQPFGGNHVTIFWDRSERTYNDALTTALLAHVLVHEITHILQRSDHHSDRGIMNAHWTQQEIRQMMWKPLSFNQSDIRLIHAARADQQGANEGIPEQISAR